MSDTSYRHESWRKSSGTPNSVFPTYNVDLLAHLSLAELGLGQGSDIWGYSSGSNHFALMLCTEGPVVINVTDPEDPAIIGRYIHTYTEAGAMWQDARSYSHYGYFVSEAGCDLVTIDMNFMHDTAGTSGPDQIISPSFVSVTSNYPTVPRNTHNLGLDTETGLLFRYGAELGIRFYDVRDDPFHPRYLGSLRSDRAYIHDAEVITFGTDDPDPFRRGKTIIFAAQDRNCDTDHYTVTNYPPDNTPTDYTPVDNCNALDIMDITSIANDRENSYLFNAEPDASLLSRTHYQFSEYAHQLWVDTETNVVYLNDELDEITQGEDGWQAEGAECILFVVSDLERPSYWKRWRDDTGIISSNHNAFGYRFVDQAGTSRKFIAQAHYSDGTRIFDITNSPTPQTVGFLDTEPDVPSVRKTVGNWGTFILPDATIMSSSITQGFFIFRYQPEGGNPPPPPPSYNLTDTTVTCGGLKAVFQNVVGGGEDSCCGQPPDTVREDLNQQCDRLLVGDLDVLGTLTVNGETSFGGGGAAPVDASLPTMREISNGAGNSVDSPQGSWTTLGEQAFTHEFAIDNAEEYNVGTSRATSVLPASIYQQDRHLDTALTAHLGRLARTGLPLPPDQWDMCNVDFVFPVVYEASEDATIALRSRKCIDSSWFQTLRMYPFFEWMFMRVDDTHVELSRSPRAFLINRVPIVTSHDEAAQQGHSAAYAVYDEDAKEMQIHVEKFYFSLPGFPLVFDDFNGVNSPTPSGVDPFGTYRNATISHALDMTLVPVQVVDGRLRRVERDQAVHWIQTGLFQRGMLNVELNGLSAQDLGTYGSLDELMFPQSLDAFQVAFGSDDRFYVGAVFDRYGAAQLPTRFMSVSTELNGWVDDVDMIPFYRKFDSDPRSRRVETCTPSPKPTVVGANPVVYTYDRTTQQPKTYSTALLVAIHEMVHQMQMNTYLTVNRDDFSFHPNLVGRKRVPLEQTRYDLDGQGHASVEGTAVYLEMHPTFNPHNVIMSYRRDHYTSFLSTLLQGYTIFDGPELAYDFYPFYFYASKFDRNIDGILQPSILVEVFKELAQYSTDLLQDTLHHYEAGDFEGVAYTHNLAFAGEYWKELSIMNRAFERVTGQTFQQHYVDFVMSLVLLTDDSAVPEKWRLPSWAVDSEKALSLTIPRELSVEDRVEWMESHVERACRNKLVDAPPEFELTLDACVAATRTAMVSVLIAQSSSFDVVKNYEYIRSTFESPYESSSVVIRPYSTIAFKSSLQLECVSENVQLTLLRPHELSEVQASCDANNALDITASPESPTFIVSTHPDPISLTTSQISYHIPYNGLSYTIAGGIAAGINQQYGELIGRVTSILLGDGNKYYELVTVEHVATEFSQLTTNPCSLATGSMAGQAVWLTTTNYNAWRASAQCDFDGVILMHHMGRLGLVGATILDSFSNPWVPVTSTTVYYWFQWQNAPPPDWFTNDMALPAMTLDLAHDMAQAFVGQPWCGASHDQTCSSVSDPTDANLQHRLDAVDFVTVAGYRLRYNSALYAFDPYSPPPPSPPPAPPCAVVNSVGVEVQLGVWSEENSVEIVSSDNTVVFTSEPWSGTSSASDGNNGELFLYNLCLVEDTYTITLYDTYGDGWNGNHYVKVTNQGNELLNLQLATGSGISDTFTIE